MVHGVFILNFIISIIMFINIILKNKIQNGGFTIMEAMVTVAIIAIMSAVYLTNYRPTNQKIILDQAASGLVADLRYAQNMAMNVKKFNDEIPQGGYGVKINNTSPGTYTIYADCDNDHEFDGVSLVCAGNTIAEKVSDRTLDSKIRITTALDISFQPPNPVVWIDGSTGVASSIITLEYGTTGVTKTITINGYTGQISAD